MRIVAGLAKGRRLAGPADGTRPTSDRAREGLFNSLAALTDLDGARVLDLFAGTGAVGLEALSRGAALAVLVEADRRASDVLRRNAAAVGLEGARIVRRPVAAFLDAPASGQPDAPVSGQPDGPASGQPDAPASGQPGDPFDIVFADPPYDLDEAELAALLDQLAGNGWLAEAAILVVERSVRGAPPTWPDGVTPVQDRRYGEGVLWYGRRQ